MAFYKGYDRDNLNVEELREIAFTVVMRSVKRSVRFGKWNYLTKIISLDEVVGRKGR